MGLKSEVEAIGLCLWLPERQERESESRTQNGGLTLSTLPHEVLRELQVVGQGMVYFWQPGSAWWMEEGRRGLRLCPAVPPGPGPTGCLCIPGSA